MSDIGEQVFADDDELFGADIVVDPPRPAAANASPSFSPFQNSKELQTKQIEAFAGHVFKCILRQLVLLYKRKTSLHMQMHFLKWKYQEKNDDNPLFIVNLKKIVRLATFFGKKRIKLSWNRWVLAAASIRKAKLLAQLKAKKQALHDKRVAKLNEEITFLMRRQIELEETIAAQSKKLKKYKVTLGESHGEDKATSSESILQGLKKKNQELKDKIEAIEGNVNVFIEEMSPLLDIPEHFPFGADDDGHGDSSQNRTRWNSSQQLR